MDTEVDNLGRGNRFVESLIQDSDNLGSAAVAERIVHSDIVYRQDGGFQQFVLLDSSHQELQMAHETDIGKVGFFEMMLSCELRKGLFDFMEDCCMFLNLRKGHIMPGAVKMDGDKGAFHLRKAHAQLFLEIGDDFFPDSKFFRIEESDVRHIPDGQIQIEFLPLHCEKQMIGQIDEQFLVQALPREVVMNRIHDVMHQRQEILGDLVHDLAVPIQISLILQDVRMLNNAS